MTSIRWRVEKGLDEHLFYSVRPLHLFLAFELREYLLNAVPCARRALSLSLSLLARNHFPMDSRRRRTKKKKSELIKKSTYPRHPINQTTFVGGKEGRKIDEEKVERTTITVGYLLLTQLRKNAFVFGEPNSARCLKPVQSASWRETKSFLEWVGE